MNFLLFFFILICLENKNKHLDGQCIRTHGSRQLVGFPVQVSSYSNLQSHNTTLLNNNWSNRTFIPTLWTDQLLFVHRFVDCGTPVKFLSQRCVYVLSVYSLDSTVSVVPRANITLYPPVTQWPAPHQRPAEPENPSGGRSKSWRSTSLWFLTVYETFVLHFQVWTNSVFIKSGWK